ncbi:MAG: ABC-F family ATP-binding cassette domain-containing protein [Bacteroidaceae bacterium]|nr:ABC-F family ATP-binding cassette domain-containing protein [Bacteroidaceae bacterium]
MVSYLQAQNLTRRVGDKTLFSDLCFSIGEGQKVGLIAKNGTGKSTLLNILCGNDQADEGQVVFHNDLRVGYLEQTPHYPLDLTVIEACFWHGNETTNLIREYETCMSSVSQEGLQDILDRMEQQKAWDYENRAKTILSKLFITEWDKPLAQLSGGQLKRVALANTLIMEPDLLILDEPTNHLDLQMIEWLENYLSRSNITLLMVTHDRYFLDRICSVILELDEETIYTYHGNYAYFLEKRAQRLEVARAEVARATNLYRTELDWMRRMPQARGHKAKYREEAFYELEKLKGEKVKKLKEKEPETSTFQLFNSSTFLGSKIFEAEYVSKAYGDLVLIKDFYYNFSRYEKLGIVGNNGTGKSTFVKMLLGLVKPDSGRFVVGETVRFGYYSQDGMEFDEQMKVIDAVRKTAEYMDLGGGQKLSAMQFLQHFMFSPQQQQNYIYKLSGGEKRRLYLCTVLMQSPNFLVLDEPTNDLDINSLQILEQYLQDFKGCVIIISHDRYFMDKVVDHLFVFKGNGIVKDFPGNYTQYREWEKLEPAAPKPQTAPRNNQTTPSNQTTQRERKRRMSFREKQEFEALGKEIDALEQEKKDIEAALSSGTLSTQDIIDRSKRLPVVNDLLDEKSMRWLELSEIE